MLQKTENGISTSDNWSWDSTDDQKRTNHNESHISNLKSVISKLKSEKQELLAQLEQLDADNQENLLKVVTIRNRLQEELAEMQEKYEQLKNEKSVSDHTAKSSREEVAKLQQKLILMQQLDEHDSLEEIKEKNNSFLVDNQKSLLELEEAQKELSVLKSSSDTLQKVFEDYKYATEKECSENIEAIKKLEVENKIIYSELQKAKDRIKSFEQKSLDDEDNCKKLAFILESYEQEVSSLKEKVEELQAHNELLDRNASEQQIDRAVQQELEQMQSSHQVHLKMLQDELDCLKAQEAQNKIDDNRIQELELNNNEMKNEINVLQSEIKASICEKMKLEQLLLEVEKQYSSEKEKVAQEIKLLKEERDELILQNNNIKSEAYEKDVTDSCTNSQETWNDLCKFNEKLTVENSNLKKYVEDLVEEKNTLKHMTQKQYEIELKELHNKYVTIVTQNIKHFQESSDIQEPTDDENSKVSEFSKQVHSIMKILLELRMKCQELEKKVS